METLLWNIIDRVMNAMVGLRVKKYKSQKMVQVNNTSFWERITVKCETTNI